MAPHDPWDKNRVDKVNRLIRSLYYVVKELEEEFVDENRKFTLDGHLVGSIGEVVAAYSFGLKLYPAGTRIHDGEKDGKMVQVKLTSGNRNVALSSKPDHLIVMQLREYKFTLVYNGPGAIVWDRCSGDPAKPGQRPIGLATLRKIQKDTEPGKMLEQEREFPDLSSGPKRGRHETVQLPKITSDLQVFDYSSIIVGRKYWPPHLDYTCSPAK